MARAHLVHHAMHSAGCATLQPLTNYAPTTPRESASYGPNILVATGSYLLLSISVSDSAGNLLIA
jgi:hypothetical protein